MAILAYDDVMLREPRLLVPGMQPLDRVRVADHGLSAGIKHAVVMSSPADCVTGRRVTLDAAGASFGPSHQSSCLLLDTGATLNRASFANPFHVGASDFTILVRLAWLRQESAKDVAVCGIWSSTTGTSEWIFFSNYTATATDYRIGFWVANASGGGTIKTDSTTQRPLNRMATVIATKRGTTITLYLDGVQIAQNASGPAAVQAFTYPIIFGSYLTTGSQNLNAAVESFMMWSRALSVAEVAAISRDPYQFLIPAT